MHIDHIQTDPNDNQQMRVSPELSDINMGLTVLLEVLKGKLWKKDAQALQNRAL
jgi:hypothetical protein